MKDKSYGALMVSHRLEVTKFCQCCQTKELKVRVRVVFVHSGERLIYERKKTDKY